MQATYNGVDKKFQYLFQNANHVEFTQSLQSGTQIGSLSIDGVSTDLYAPTGGGSSTLAGLTDTDINTPTDGQYLTYNATSSKWVNTTGGGGGTTVIANPSGAATDDLEKVQIGNTIYDIPGSGGSGGRFRQEIIYDTPVSTAGNITVSDFGDADSLTFVLGIYVSGDSYQTFINEIPMVEFKTGEVVFIGGTLTQSSGTTWSKYAAIKYVDDTTIQIVDIDGHYWGETGYIYRIYKNIYAASVIYLPTIYSEEERQVGVWTDGKPLWQKTFITTPSSASYDIDVSSLNIERMISRFGALTKTISVDNVQQKDVEYRTETSTYNTYGVIVELRNSNLYIDISGYSYNEISEVRITLQYTKTTDTPGSGTWTPDGNLSHHYSTTEHIIGTWIDGSTIYERTIQLTADLVTSDSSWTPVQYNNQLTNIGVLIDCKRLNDTASYLTDRYTNNNGVLSAASKESGTILRSGNYLTLQYTKSS